jgi:hypothetical protein
MTKTNKFLDKYQKLFGKYALSEGSGGCSTCGYGADSVMSEWDFKSLLNDIDVWIKEEFGNEKD